MKPPKWKAPRCASGKVGYRNQGTALRALDQIARDNAQAVAPTSEPPVAAYPCRCGAWHLTKKSGVRRDG